jgi:hypothetical protein
VWLFDNLEEGKRRIFFTQKKAIISVREGTGYCGQATKGAWWMSWRQESMKDAGSCDKLREAANQAEIRRFPNGETRRG